MDFRIAMTDAGHQSGVSIRYRITVIFFFLKRYVPETTTFSTSAVLSSRRGAISHETW